jgi:hypothetical protein
LNQFFQKELKENKSLNKISKKKEILGQTKMEMMKRMVVKKYARNGKERRIEEFDKGNSNWDFVKGM